MRNNVECKRCPCGAILSLRESCKACADRARARLHADGIARQEIQEKRFEAAQDLVWYSRLWSVDEVAKHEPMPERIRRELDALRQSGKITTLSTPATLTERQRRMFGDGHAMEPPPVDRTFQVTYPGTWEDGAPVYTNACGMPSRTPDPFVTREQMELGQADHDRRWREDTQRGVSDFFIGTDYGDAAAVAVAVTSLRLKHDTWFVLDVQELAKHEPPPVGAEVAWDVAKADMQARSEARYKISSDLGVEYSYAARGTLSCRNDELETWRTSVMYEDACDKRRWVRLA